MAGGPINTVPNLQTLAASSVTVISSVLNGNVIDGGSFWDGSNNIPGTITERGFYFGTNPDPINYGTKVIISGTTGSYNYSAIALSANTTYYFITYAINQNGRGVGSILSFIYSLPANSIPKRYIYKIYNNSNVYLGNLPNVTSIFNITKTINTTGSKLSITCGVSADTSLLPGDYILDEAGYYLTDEAGNRFITEGQVPIVAIGNSKQDTLIKNGNIIKVWEYGYYYPNGKLMFSGSIRRWESIFGNDSTDDAINILAYSNGQDLDNYLIRGYPYVYTLDQSQTAQNGFKTITGGGGTWHRWGQSFKANSLNLGAISLLLNGTSDVTIRIWDGFFNGTLLGVATKSVSVSTPTEIQFTPSTVLPTVIGNIYYYSVEASGSIDIGYSDANPYANGDMYESVYGGGNNIGSYIINNGYDMYFKTLSGTGSTNTTFSSLDPSTGMLEIFMNDYIARGGSISYNSNTIKATGLSLSYGFNTNTIYEGIKSILSLAPAGFYYYVDIATNLLYFLQSNTVADVLLVKGRHIGALKLVATVENVKNSVNLTGGDNGGGVNLYKQYSDIDSITLYGVQLDRLSDNQVTISGTADAIGLSDLIEKKDELYQTTVTIFDSSMDITLLNPGMITGFRGYGTFVDQLLAQIVIVNYVGNYVELTLGIIPKRIVTDFDKITRGLIAMQTIANPTSPS